MSEQTIRSEFAQVGHQGKQRHVRLVESEQEVRIWFEHWSQGGTPISVKQSSKGTITGMSLPDGTEVFWRSFSRTGGPTTEIRLHGEEELWKVHIRPPGGS